MTDRENVIKEFEHLLNEARGDYQDFVDLTVDEGKEILALLKKYKPIKPKNDAFGHPCCPKCEILAYRSWRFCPHCGQEMKWDG